jgi:hypothetical protein
MMPPPTPKTSRGPLSFLNSITHRTPKTPKQKSPIKPEGVEMHPAHHQKTATPYDEARWLGFFKMGSHPEPSKPATPPVAAASSPTPMKSPIPDLNAVPSPNFQFTFARERPFSLSAEAQALIAETEEEVAKVRAEMLANMPSVPESGFEPATGRKIAKPKGKAGRFSDVHMAQFKKMDSIANHASAWRMDPNRLKPVTQALKRSSSKAELDEPAPQSLKQSPSKAELDQPSKTSLPRMSSSSTLHKPTLASLKRSPSKINLNASGENTPSKTPGRIPVSSPAKRVKRDMSDDASTNRPVPQDSSSKPPNTIIHKGSSLARSKSGLLRPGFTNLMTPTKSSLARTQSINNIGGEAVSMLPSLARSKSTQELLQPQTPKQTKTPIVSAAPTPTPMKTMIFAHDSPVKAPELPSSPLPMLDQTPVRVKSILRTPNRRYTRDPSKIAAGTHLSTPPMQVPALRVPPATALVRKQVNFSASTKEMDMEEVERDAVKAASVEPEPVHYPVLRLDNSPRRTTVSDLPMPGAFTFRSDREVSFSGGSSTIRPVRVSDTGVSSLSFTPKRKLDTLSVLGEEAEDSSKENRDEDENRPAKKARMTGSAVAPTPRKSKLPTRKGARASGMTASRLHMLATPKRRN